MTKTTLTEQQKEFILLLRSSRPQGKTNLFRHYSRNAGIAAAHTYLKGK
jgi:hypothetical protein